MRSSSHLPQLPPELFAHHLGVNAASGLRLMTLVAFCIVAYLPSFAVSFAFDDIPNILLNPRVQPESWTDIGQSLNARTEQDRPVVMFTFALNYLYGGLAPVGYHVVNLAVHVLSSIVLLFLLQGLAVAPRSPDALQRRATVFAFSATLIWAVHPVNTQAVTYIVQRMASMAALFYLLVLLVFVLWRLGRLPWQWALLTAVPASLLAIGSKLNTITLPAAILLLDIAFFTGFRKAHGAYLLIVALAAVTAVLIWGAGHHQFLFDAHPERGFSGIERTLTQGRVVWHYLSLLAWPDAARLQVDYNFAISRSLLTPPTTLVAWAGLAIISTVSVLNLNKHPWPAAGWLFFCLALSVESSFILLELAFEHRLYLPATLLIAGAVATIVTKLPEGRPVRLFSFVGLALAAVLAAQTIQRNHEWGNLGTLWAGDMERGASANRAGLNSAVQHLRRGEPSRALAVLRKIEVSELDERHYQAKGEALFALGDFDRALGMFRLAFEHRPTWSRTAYFYGQSLIQLDRDGDAADLAGQMQQHAPDSVFTAALRAEVFLSQRHPDRAIEVITEYIERHPESPAVNMAFIHTYTGNLYVAIDRPDQAIEHYRVATQFDAENWGAWMSLQKLLAETGRVEQSRAVLRYLRTRGITMKRESRVKLSN